MTYAFELYADPEMTTLVASQSGLFGGSEMTAWTVPARTSGQLLVHLAGAGDGWADFQRMGIGKLLCQHGQRPAGKFCGQLSPGPVRGG